MDRYQLAAARGMLGWTLKELSEKTNITIEAINKFERGEVDSPRKSTIEALRTAFENEGIEFIDQSGVRKRNQSLNISYGHTALEALYNKIYDYVVGTQNETELLCSGFSQQQLKKHLSTEFDVLHRSRMSALNKKVFFKTLISELDESQDIVSYSEYKRLPEDYFFETPFYVFGDTLAIVTWEDPLQVIIIKNKNISEVYRRQFGAMWKLASSFKHAE